MREALLAEYRKLVSTRMWWLLALIMVAYLGFIGVAMSFSIVASDDPTADLLDGRDAAMAIYGLTNMIGYVFPLLIGSLAMTGEFRHRTITQTLLVEPRRTVFLLAKVTATVPIGVVYGVLAVAAVVAGAAPLLAWQGDGAYLTDGTVWQSFGWSLLVMVLWTIIGVGIGTLIPNQIAAVVVILGVTQFVEPIARVGLAAFDATDGVAKFLPAAAADAVIGSSFFNSMMGAASDVLPRWAGILVMLGYATVFAVIGRATTLRRDVG